LAERKERQRERKMSKKVSELRACMQVQQQYGKDYVMNMGELRATSVGPPSTELCSQNSLLLYVTAAAVIGHKK
jgi:hypothetical protein